MFPKTFIFQATIKGKKTKTISDCRKYRICLSILSSLSHMYSCQRTGYVHRILSCTENATATGDLR